MHQLQARVDTDLAAAQEASFARARNAEIETAITASQEAAFARARNAEAEASIAAVNAQRRSLDTGTITSPLPYCSRRARNKIALDDFADGVFSPFLQPLHVAVDDLLLAACVERNRQLGAFDRGNGAATELRVGYAIPDSECTEASLVCGRTCAMGKLFPARGSADTSFARLM